MLRDSGIDHLRASAARLDSTKGRSAWADAICAWGCGATRSQTNNAVSVWRYDPQQWIAEEAGFCQQQWGLYTTEPRGVLGGSGGEEDEEEPWARNGEQRWGPRTEDADTCQDTGSSRRGESALKWWLGIDNWWVRESCYRGLKRR